MKTITIISAIASIISQAEKFKGAYFFTPAANSILRASYDKFHSRDTVEWDDNGHHYTARFDVCSTCSHVEAHGVYYKDGKKTTLTAIKNSYKRLCESEGK